MSDLMNKAVDVLSEEALRSVSGGAEPRSSNPYRSKGAKGNFTPTVNWQINLDCKKHSVPFEGKRDDDE